MAPIYSLQEYVGLACLPVKQTVEHWWPFLAYSVQVRVPVTKYLTDHRGVPPATCTWPRKVLDACTVPVRTGEGETVRVPHQDQSTPATATGTSTGLTWYAGAGWPGQGTAMLYLA
jgi:hypothetical protein